jgi:uncharacterized protein (UPF0261 family)
MEKLADSGLLAGAIEVSTTEIADEVAGGVLSAGPTRLDVLCASCAALRRSCGALDMVNFARLGHGAQRFKRRTLPPQRHVTLMRTTPTRAGASANSSPQAQRMTGRALPDPEGGCRRSTPGQPFHDPEADRALFAPEQAFRPGRIASCQLPCTSTTKPCRALVAAWREAAAARPRAPRHRTPMPASPTDPARPLPRQDRAAPATRRRRCWHRPVGQVRRGRRAST